MLAEVNRKLERISLFAGSVILAQAETCDRIKNQRDRRP